MIIYADIKHISTFGSVLCKQITPLSSVDWNSFEEVQAGNYE